MRPKINDAIRIEDDARVRIIMPNRVAKAEIVIREQRLEFHARISQRKHRNDGKRRGWRCFVVASVEYPRVYNSMGENDKPILRHPKS